MIARLDDADTKIVESYFTHNENDEIVSVYVGYGDIKEIRYHYPLGDGDKHFCDVYDDKGLAWREFDIISVTFVKE